MKWSVWICVSCLARALGILLVLPILLRT